MSIFKEEVVVDEESNKIIVTVSCEKRKLALDPKQKYKKNIISLIPEKFQNNVELISQPENPISNMRYEDHRRVGVWVFSIRKDEEKIITSPSKSRRTRNIKKQPEKDN